jgi:iron complex outermembrane recepter protein
VSRTLLACMAFGATLAFAPAIGRTEGADETAVQSGGENSEGIGEIIVTARKREESAQSTPISLTVTTADDLKNRSIVSLAEVQQLTPSLTMTQASLSPSSTYFSGRGLTVNDTRLTTDPAFGYYVDGVIRPGTLGSGLPLLDVARIEVLNGPQGTLYGKNNTGGAVNVYTNLPTHNFEGLVKVEGGSYGTAGAGAVLNIPVSPTLAIRAVGQYNYRDGYGTNSFNGEKYGHLGTESGRISALWEPIDALTVTVRADYTKSDATSTAYKGANAVNVPSAVTTEIMRETGVATPAAAAALLLGYANGSFNSGSTNVMPFEDMKLYGASANIDWRLSEHLSVKSITAIRRVLRTAAVDLDASPFQLLDFPYLNASDAAFSQELQLSGTAFADRLNYIVGGFYGDENGRDVTVQRALGVLSAASGPGVTNDIFENKTIAGFAQGTYRIIDQLSATGGVRYTKDERFLTAANYTNVACNSLGVSIASLGGAPCIVTLTPATFHATTYTASLEYHPVTDILLYLKADHGYRTGGLPGTGGSAVSPAAAALSFRPYNPEYVQSYESGIKSDLLERKLRVNLDYYRATYSDLQRNVTLPVPGTLNIVNAVANIAKARVQGVEGHLTALPFKGLELSGVFAYTNPVYLSYTVNGTDLSHQPFVEAPKWTYGVSATYTAHVRYGSVTGELDYSWVDTTTTVPPAGIRPSYETLNARISLATEGGLEVAVYGKNLTNDQVSMFQLDEFAALGAIFNGPSSPPRTLGVEVIKHF